MDINVIIKEFLSYNLYVNILYSLKIVFIGFILAFIISLVLAIILNQFSILNKIIYPVLEFLRPIPNAGWVPISILICNSINESILLITFVGAFFPMFINIYRALDKINKNYLDIAKLYELDIFDKIKKILIPSILPNIFTSMMLGISGAWLSVIMAEMISGKIGLGYYTWKGYTLLCYEKLFVGIICMGILGLSFSIIISKISSKVLFWVKEED